MPYAARTYQEILDAILADYANQIPGADVSAGSDIYVKASALASAVWGLYRFQAWTVRQVFPDTADSNELERHAAIRGMARKQAAKAAGTVTLTGADGTVAASGLSLRAAGGVYLLTTSGGTISTGFLDVSARAKDGGVSGNLAAGLALTVQDPPAGVSSAASVKTNFTGGADIEKDSDLLSRLLDIIRQPPAGGNKKDYELWAKEVSGVSECRVYPARRGAGTVDLAVLTSGAGAARIPQQALLDGVKAHIDLVRPITVKDMLVLAPTAKSQAVTASIKPASGYTFAQVQPWITTAVTDWLDRMSPLEVLYKSKLEKVISDVEGVDDRIVTVPAGNVTPVDDGASVIEMITPGAITITQMA